MTPRLTLSIDALRAARACDLDARIADLRTVLPDVADGDAVDVRVWWSLPSTSTADAIWSLRAAQPPERAATVGVLVARCAAHRAGSYAAAAARLAAAATDAAARAAYAAANAAANASDAAAWAAAATDAAARAAYAAASDASDAARAERDAQMADLLAALEIAP